MTYTRIASAVLAATLPLTVLAADMSASDILGAVLSDQRPETLYLKTTKESQGRTMTVTVTGAREGGLAGKMWTRTSVDWRSGDEWLKTQAEIRLKNNKAYFMIRTASASAGIPAAPEFSAAAGTWYELDLHDPAVKDWFMADLDVSHFGSLFSLVRTRYQGGYANAFTQNGKSSDIVSALHKALPPLLVPDSMEGAKLKVDTNGLGAFQFASMKGSAFEARVQRQLGAVYVETPKATKPLPRGEIAAMFFSPTSGAMPDMPKPVEPPAPSSSAQAVDRDANADVRQPVAKSSVKGGTLRRTAERAIIDLIGPNRVNVKRTVRLALTQTRWDSPADFRSDFSRDGGVLYSYPSPSKPVFTTKGAYAPLDVIFFDEKGGYISSGRMRKCEGSVCPEVTPDRPATFALQVEEGFIMRHRMGNLWRLDLSWYNVPQETGLTPQQIDRMARRNMRTRQTVSSAASTRVIGETGYESLRTLAGILAGKVRSSDVASLRGVRPDQTVAMSLFTMLADTVQTNPGIRHAYIVRPTDAPDAFALLVDNLTFATSETLDVDKSGTVEADEEPAKPGTLYSYPALGQAILKTSFVHLSDNGDVTVFAPVRDANGNVIALVAVMQPAAK